MRRKTTLDRRILWSIRFCAIALFGVFIWSLIQNLVGLLSLDGRLLAAREENNNLNQEYRQLETLATEYNNGYFLEKDIREKLGLVKENEVVVIIPDDYFENKESSYSSTIDFLSTSKVDPVWKQWVLLFF